MVKLIGLLRRKDGMDRAAFREHFETVHVPLALRHAGHLLVKYQRTYISLPSLDDTYAGRDGDDAGPDVISELTFRDEEAVAEFFDILSQFPEFLADEAHFLDRSASRGGRAIDIVESLTTG